MDRQAEARETARQHASRALYVYQDEDGMVTVRGRLAPEVGALLMHALTAARETLYQQARGQEADADPPTMAQQQADTLALPAETAPHHASPSSRMARTRKARHGGVPPARAHRDPQLAGGASGAGRSPPRQTPSALSPDLSRSARSRAIKNSTPEPKPSTRAAYMSASGMLDTTVRVLVVQSSAVTRQACAIT